MVLRKAFQSSLLCRRFFFFFGKKIDRFWADIANPDIPRFTYLLILSQCLEKCGKDWELALKEDRLVKSRILGTSLKFKEPRHEFSCVGFNPAVDSRLTKLLKCELTKLSSKL